MKTKSIIQIIFLLILIFFPFYSYGVEEVQLTTYYPAPYGDYENVTNNCTEVYNVISNPDPSISDHSGEEDSFTDDFRFVNINRGMRVFGDCVGPFNSTKLSNASSDASTLNYIEFDPISATGIQSISFEYSGSNVHRMIVDTANNTMELREFGNMIFSSGSTSDTVTNTMFLKNDGAVGLGREPGTEGTAKLELYGANANITGPHIQAVTDVDDSPVFQQRNWSHDDISLNFDAYYDGAWKSSYLNSNFQISKYDDNLKFNYSSGNVAGVSMSWSSGLQMNASGYIGVGTSPSIYAGYVLSVKAPNGNTSAIEIIAPDGSDSLRLQIYKASSGMGASFSTIANGGMSFLTDSTSRITIKSNGEVDILNNLDVRGDLSCKNLLAIEAYSSSDPVVLNMNAGSSCNQNVWCALNMEANVTRAAGIKIDQGSSGGKWWMGTNYNGGAQSVFQVGYNTTGTGPENQENAKLRIDSDGSIYFPGLSPGVGLFMMYNLSTQEVYYMSSSIRYKENIRPYNKKEYKKIYDIPIKVFDSKINKDEKDIVGVIAEDLVNIFPKLVCYNEKKEIETYSSIDFIPVLIKALQEQKKTIDSLTARIEILESKKNLIVEI